MSEEPRKRSRFDQTEPEPKKASRFDRRSRSPSTKQSESRRSRSPLQRSSATPDTTKKDPAAAAAAAAAKINASLESKKGIQHVDVPPIRAVHISSFQPINALAKIEIQSSSAGPKSPPTVAQVDGEIYQQDGDYIKDIEVNDLRNRYTLTKGATQKMVITSVIPADISPPRSPPSLNVWLSNFDRQASSMCVEGVMKLTCRTL